MGNPQSANDNSCLTEKIGMRNLISEMGKEHKAPAGVEIKLGGLVWPPP